MTLMPSLLEQKRSTKAPDIAEAIQSSIAPKRGANFPNENLQMPGTHLNGCVCSACCTPEIEGPKSSEGSIDSLWKQPGGKSNPLTLTYSYTQGFLNDIKGISKTQIKASVEKALAVYAKYVPINFVEVKDQGANAQTLLNQFVPVEQDDPQLRFHSNFINGDGGTFAFAYFPSETHAIGGDLFFDKETWDSSANFVEGVLHELGHTLGLRHENSANAIMNPSIKGRFSSLDQADLLPDDIQTIVRGYGSGKGSVKPLSGSPTPPPKPPTSSNKSVIRGTVGADTLIGGSNSQRIVGKRGNDTLDGKGGNDKLIGDHGNDRLLGGSGNDELLGGANNDTLLGGTGNDKLLGGDGNDVLQGAWRRRSAEKDVMTGGRGRDTFVLGNESGTLYDDGNAQSMGTKNYALITDLNVSQGDIIQLSDNYNYRLGSSPKGVDSGRALFIDNGAGQQDELIAVIRGASNLNLNSSTFNLV